MPEAIVTSENACARTLAIIIAQWYTLDIIKMGKYKSYSSSNNTNEEDVPIIDNYSVQRFSLVRLVWM